VSLRTETFCCPKLATLTLLASSTFSGTPPLTLTKFRAFNKVLLFLTPFKKSEVKSTLELIALIKLFKTKF